MITKTKAYNPARTSSSITPQPPEKDSNLFINKILDMSNILKKINERTKF